MTEQNLWRVVSRGFAANNVELDSNILEVYCPELTGFADGEINSDTKELTTQGMDDKGKNYTVKIVTANTVKAKWKPNGTNRITSPDVRRGERVEVWQYADADMYYWSTTGEDDNLRRLETVTHVFSNTKDENTKELTKENSYAMTVSTHQKKVEFSTSKSDGEPFNHTLQLDTKIGLFTYKDDIGNIIQVNSDANQIFIENADGSKVVMDGGKISVTAPASIDLNAPTVTINGENFISNAHTRLNDGTTTKGSLTNNGKDVGSGHTHSGVSSGYSNTKAPN